jgi:hypothetical protein
MSFTHVAAHVEGEVSALYFHMCVKLTLEFFMFLVVGFS